MVVPCSATVVPAPHMVFPSSITVIGVQATVVPSSAVFPGQCCDCPFATGLFSSAGSAQIFSAMVVLVQATVALAQVKVATSSVTASSNGSP
jgi:hypothetical protein